MERRILVGSFGTALVVVAAALANFVLDGAFVGIVLAAGLAGGLIVGLLSRTAGHVGAGARAGAYGGAAGFVAFVVVGVVQAALDGDLSVLVLGVQTLLVALLVLPVHALLGAGAATVGVRLRRAAGRETAL